MSAQPVSQPRAAVYVRVSTAGQEAEGTSLDSQEAYCRQHAATQGYDVAEGHVYREVFTGTELWDRPRLNQLRGAIRAGDVDALIVHATDRLSRDPVHLAILAEECERYRAELLFVTEPLDMVMGSAQMIQVDREHGCYVASSDPRGDGVALAL